MRRSAAVLDYQTFCQIRDHLERQRLTVAQTARALGMDPRTVAKWAEVQQFRPRAGTPRGSKLDAFKGQIVRWLDAHPYSAQQIYQRLREAGYEGGVSIVKAYVRIIRPRRGPFDFGAKSDGSDRQQRRGCPGVSR
jgi:transposase